MPQLSDFLYRCLFYILMCFGGAVREVGCRHGNGPGPGLSSDDVLVVLIEYMCSSVVYTSNGNQFNWVYRSVFAFRLRYKWSE